ncbi:hypothetical protein [Nocardia sp. NPDC019395]|uniref:hypothetical protein n=1 Tax=Nocardia sp. NPDC019395 TaxID=3154686 RepID=UPI0033E0B452
MDDNEPPRAPTVGIDIPPGYYEIPLDQVADLGDRYLPMVIDAIPDGVRGSASAVVETMQFLIGTMISNNALYCGIGVHRSVQSDENVVSWLTVSSFAYGPARNPRLVIGDLVAAKAAHGETGHLEIIELGHRPALYFERTVSHGKPEISGYPGDAEEVAVFQVQTVVPSEDGECIAVVDFSTANAPHGPEYRAMILGMAASIEFPAPSIELGSLSIAL